MMLLTISTHRLLHEPLLNTDTSTIHQVVGGVALAAPYYQHVLAIEGRTEQVPACQLLITCRRQQDLLLLPATQVKKPF